MFTAATRPPIVDIEPKGQAVVRLGDSLRIMCTMGSPLQICRVEIHGESSMILRPNQSSDDGIEYYGEGTNKGQCGVHIFKVKEQHNGIFRCALTPEDRRVESNASVNIVVASKYYRLIIVIIHLQICIKSTTKNMNEFFSFLFFSINVSKDFS